MPEPSNDSHHHRKEHPRKKQSGSYGMVRATVVRNRGRTTPASSVAPPPSANLNAVAALPSDGVDYDSVDADDVLFALEEPEWSSQGFNRETAAHWKKYAFTPEEAREWRRSGAAPHYASRWVISARYAVQEKIPFAVAKQFLDNNITSPEMASEWLTSGIPPSDAIAWINAGVDIRSAWQWRRNGMLTPQEKDEWEQLGFSDPEEIAAVQRLGDEAALRWWEAGATFKQGAAFNGLLTDVYDEKAIMKMAKWPDMSPYFMREWIHNDVPVDQVREFILKGYTPKKAAIQIRSGKTSASAKDRRNGQLVPGKAWLEIKAKFDELKNNGEQVTLRSQKGPNGNVSVKFEIGPPGKNTNTIFNFKFMYTGAFVSANSNISKKRRTVSTKAEFFRLHFP